MPRSRAFALAAFATIALTGCADVSGWVKPGVDAKQQRRDEQECNKQAIAAAGPGSDARLFYARCMEARGYELGQK